MSGGTEHQPSLDALLPQEMLERAVAVGVTKANMAFGRLVSLGVLGGAFIAFGAMFSSVVTSDPGTLGGGFTRLVGGVTFALGLVLVVIGGAELFTGNNLLTIAFAQRRVSLRLLVRNWVIVYVANLVGAVAIALLVFATGQYKSSSGLVGKRMLDVAERPSDLCAVFGIGGLGHLAMQYAQIACAQVAAVDIHPSKLQLAKDLGAAYAIDASEIDPSIEIQKCGGADAAVVLAATPTSVDQAYRSLKRGGRLVLVGLPKDNEFSLPIFQTVLNGITVVGSIVGTRKDMAEVFELHAQGRTKVIRETHRLDEVNDCIESVLRGDVDARVVFDLR